MNVLPNYQVLNFVEWLLKKHTDKQDLARFLDNRQALILLADKYLESDFKGFCFKKRAKMLFDKALDRFCRKRMNCNDECRPSKCCDRCESHYRKERCYKNHRHFREELHMIFHDYLDREFDNEETYRDFEKIDARDLADSFIELYKSNGNFQGQVRELRHHGKQDTPMFAPKKNYEQLRSLEEILDRYHRIPFKCIILHDGKPVDKDKEEGFSYEKLIKEYWTALNETSADFLDIYHTSKDFGKSGSLIDGQELKLDIFRDYFPCILLWEKSKAEYEAISIAKLSESEIYDVIKNIVSSIQKHKSIKQIVKTAGNFVKSILESKRSVINHSITFQGPVGNVVMGDNYGSLIASFKITNKYNADFDKMTKFIKGLADIQRDTLDQALQIVADAKDAAQLGNKAVQKEVKSKAKKFWSGVGKVVFEALNVAGNFATILGLFL